MQIAHRRLLKSQTTALPCLFLAACAADLDLQDSGQLGRVCPDRQGDLLGLTRHLCYMVGMVLGLLQLQLLLLACAGTSMQKLKL